jgi:formylmethanofuran dehydrogenase subunit E
MLSEGVNISKYKQCSKCGEIKLVQRFDKDAKGKDGYKNICKICRKNE